MLQRINKDYDSAVFHGGKCLFGINFIAIRYKLKDGYAVPSIYKLIALPSA